MFKFNFYNHSPFFFKRFFYIFFYKAFNFVAPQEGENIILERIFAKQNKGFYVDVGAHHPVRFSNTLNLYQRGWLGINIEPNHKVIKNFKKMRARDINLNIAISTKKNSCNYYKFEEPALNTTDMQICKMREKQGYKCIEKKIVQTQTLNQIFLEHCKNKSIDLLKIDVEGKELDVLQSNNWNKFIPKVIICELINVDFEKLLKNKVYKFLKSHNYLLYCKLLQNSIFFHKSFSIKLFK
jgi:FkbM family methyltransferase